MSLPETVDKLTHEFLSALEQGEFPFDELLARIVRYQWERIPVLRQYWESRGFSPEHVFTANDVPGVPTDVFRHVQLVSNEAPVTKIFRTSGTTSGARGEHHHIDTRAYEAGAILHFRRQVLSGQTKAHFINVAFPPTTNPDSSLSHMLEDFGRHIGVDARSLEFYFDKEEGLRADALQARFESAREEGAPVILFGTAFGLADAVDHIPATGLPEGSLIIQTGGFKGRREALNPAEFYQLLSDHFGVQPSNILAEYGMTELSSQLWSNLSQPAPSASESAARLLVPPPWCLVQAVDPVTLQPLPTGQQGLLRFVDLANIDSVVAVQTSDLGVIHANGVELIGRAPGATPRGCSLAIEEVRAIAAR